jgi:hypothetical protein
MGKVFKLFWGEIFFLRETAPKQTKQKNSRKKEIVKHQNIIKDKNVTQIKHT